MADSRFFRATMARARCAAGEFVLMGRMLQPLSLAHYSILDELLEGDLFSTEQDAMTLDIISRVCSQPVPAFTTRALDDAERARYSMSLLQFEAEQELLTWQVYFDACFLSRPRVGVYEGGTAADYRAPWPLVVLTMLLRHCPGYSHDALWHEMPVSEVLWRYEALREQKDERSYLARTDEPEPEPSPEEKAKEEQHVRRARMILAKFQPERAKALKVRDRKARAARVKAIDAEQARLLGLSAQGRLNDTLEEV